MKMNADNFSFAKARVSYDNEHETVRAAHGGRGLNPVKNAQQRQQVVHNVVCIYLNDDQVMFNIFQKAANPYFCS
jgi:hypothetical protein